MDEGNAARAFRARGGSQLGDRAVGRRCPTPNEPLTAALAKRPRGSAVATRHEPFLQLSFITVRNSERGEGGTQDYSFRGRELASCL